VPEACSATVSIASLKGLSRQHKGEARLWLNDSLLGPLRIEHGGKGWVSVDRVYFPKGRHTLSIECGDEPFVMAGVRVGERGPESRHPSAGQVPEAETMEEPAEAGKDAGASGRGGRICQGLSLNTQWLPGKPGRAIMHSVVSGAAVRTPQLTLLKKGEHLRWWFYIHPRPGKGDSLRYAPILLEWLKTDDGKWLLAFSVDHKEMRKALEKKKKDYEPRPFGYRPEKWTPLDLEFCPDGNLRLNLNDGELRGEFAAPVEELPIYVQTREIEFEIKGKNP
jgi:hypothetical protein